MENQPIVIEIPPVASARPPHVPDKVRRGYLFGALCAAMLVVGYAAGAAITRADAIVPESGPVCAGQVYDREAIPDYALKDVRFGDFWRVWDAVKAKHVNKEQVTDSQMFYGAIAGMVAALGDPYSVFFDPEYAQKFNEELNGTFSGVGMEIGVKQDQITVIAPLAGTPAERAGLRARDRVLAIDDVSTIGMTSEEAVMRIRGPKGTTVKLTILREGWEETKEFSIVRDVIQVKSVKYKLEQKNARRLAVITISSFSDDTVSAFNQAVRSALLDNAEAVILDLRNNPGGYLEAAVALAGEWTPRDVVVVEKFSDGGRKDYRADGAGRLAGLPTVVLVNAGSASASEILAGALQDYGLGQTVGEKTYGKGSVQEYETYADGSALKLTVALWYTPKDRSIDKDGLVPDVEVKMSTEDFNADRDPQMDKALEMAQEKLRIIETKEATPQPVK